MSGNQQRAVTVNGNRTTVEWQQRVAMSQIRQRQQPNHQRGGESNKWDCNQPSVCACVLQTKMQCKSEGINRNVGKSNQTNVNTNKVTGKQINNVTCVGNVACNNNNVTEINVTTTNKPTVGQPKSNVGGTNRTQGEGMERVMWE